MKARVWDHQGNIKPSFNDEMGKANTSNLNTNIHKYTHVNETKSPDKPFPRYQPVL